METADLPISMASWALALLPIVVLLILLAVRRWKAPQAGPVGMFAAAAVAVLVLRTPWDTLAVAGAKGIWDAIYILYVVWSALLLYLGPISPRTRRGVRSCPCRGMASPVTIP